MLDRALGYLVIGALSTALVACGSKGSSAQASASVKPASSIPPVDMNAVCGPFSKDTASSDACGDCLEETVDSECTDPLETCVGIKEFGKDVEPCLQKCTVACFSGLQKCCECAFGCVEKAAPKCLPAVAEQQTCALRKCKRFCSSAPAKKDEPKRDD